MGNIVFSGADMFPDEMLLLWNKKGEQIWEIVSSHYYSVYILINKEIVGISKSFSYGVNHKQCKTRNGTDVVASEEMQEWEESYL